MLPLPSSRGAQRAQASSTTAPLREWIEEPEASYSVHARAHERQVLTHQARAQAEARSFCRAQRSRPRERGRAHTHTHTGVCAAELTAA